MYTLFISNIINLKKTYSSKRKQPKIVKIEDSRDPSCSR